jgi:TRAP-type mannitol/chloroaromatic compound transport system substrate-binding protein
MRTIPAIIEHNASFQQWEGGTANHFMSNLQKWNELPKNYQAIVTATSGFTNIQQTGRYDARNPAALKRLAAAGTHLRPFSQAIMEACLKASQEVNAETSAANLARLSHTI